MNSTAQQATIHRMVFDQHTCPWGLKALDLLKRKGFRVEDRPLRSREETDRLKADLGVKTTPQIFIGDERIGGYDDLRRHLGMAVRDPKALTYRPVIALFAMTALMALAASHAVYGTPVTIRAAEWFAGFSMCVLAMLKLRDVQTFSSMFLNYDLLARRFVPYATLYPFAEGLAGLLMVAGALTWLSVPLALFIGTVGAASVFKAVWLDRRQLKCACVGGDSNVPLGFISMTENVMMVAMALWMAFAALTGFHGRGDAGAALLMADTSGGDAAGTAGGTAAGTAGGGADGMPGMDHSAHDSMAMAADTPATAGYRAANAAMHQGKGGAFTGDADVDFMTAMIPHHQAAIAMAAVVLDHGSDPQVRGLATAIGTAQEAEVAFMRDWLARRVGTASGDGAATAAFQAADAAMMAGMDIAYTNDPDADFMAGMIPHHQGAVDMARAVLLHGSDPQVRDFASKVIAAQVSEIEQMTAMLAAR